MPQYEKGVSIKDIKNKKASTINLSKNALGIMMADRTAARHQRRGHDRRQMAKRLARLVLTECFEFDFDEHQEAISFLLNRRGRILEDNINAEVLREVPCELCKIVYEWTQTNKDARVLQEIFSKDKNGNDIDPDEYIDLNDPIQNVIESIYKGKVEQAESIRDSLSEYSEISNNMKGKNSLPKKIKRLEEYSEKNEEQKKELKELKKSLAKREKTIQKYKDSLKINPFDFQQNCDDKNIPPKPIDDKDKIAKQKYYSYVIWNIYKEIEEAIENEETGHALRSTYFNHLKDDLKEAKNISPEDKKIDPIDRKLASLVKYLVVCEKLHKDKNKRLDAFLNIIGNIANIQLRGLRKYFNNEEHKQEDKWLASNLDKYYLLWLRSLRPKEDDKETIAKLINQLKSKSLSAVNGSKAVALWLHTEPKETIPPFENQNNRRPPECRSLLLKPHKLDKIYPNWRSVVKKLINHYTKGDKDNNIYTKWLKETEEQLNIFSLSKVEYIKVLEKNKLPQDEINKRCWGIKREREDDILYCRSLQFILDISLAHQDNILVMRKVINYDNDYTAITKLLGKDSGDFIKLIEEYYKEIRHSMDGRWFDENSSNLLSPCNEKPKHKKYQMSNDFGALLGLTAEQVNKLIGINPADNTIGEVDKKADKIEFWLNRLKIKTHASNCAKLQKDVGNSLDSYIGAAKDKQERKMELSTEEKDLIKVSDKSKTLAGKLAEAINDELDMELDPDTFNSVFTFAQINNIVFAERSGNAKNCPCCSVDNQARMQKMNSAALATRLRGYIARPIDGVLRKLLEAKARKIAKLKLDQIKEFNPAEIRIPIITEQNKFSFEQMLGDAHKGKINAERLKRLQEPRVEFEDKESRIKKASKDICPYSGKDLSTAGEIDHIISRSSTTKAKQTVLNSEANLIYVSSRSNRDKDKREYHLEDLNSKYLNQQFHADDPGEIRSWIYEKLKIDSNHIGSYLLKRKKLIDIKKDNAIFRNFSNFLWLSSEQKVAFRHALFLKPKEPARQLVELCLDTSDKTKVNGSQRYFASLIAQNINKAVENHNKKNEHNKISSSITYDYFEVEASKIYEQREYLKSIKPETEKKNPQSKYSHSIDATLTFLTATQEPVVVAGWGKRPSISRIGLTQSDDDFIILETKTGELRKDNYDAIEIKELSDDYLYIPIVPKNANSDYFLHRKIHRASFYSAKYLPLLICKDKKKSVRLGFNMQEGFNASIAQKDILGILITVLRFCNLNEIDPVKDALAKIRVNNWKELNKENYKQFIEACQTYIEDNRKDYLYLHINKEAAQRFMLDKLNTSIAMPNEKDHQIHQTLRNLSYHTMKVKVIDKIEGLLITTDKEGKKVFPQEKDKKYVWNELEKKLIKGSIKLPVYETWKTLIEDIYERNKEESSKNLTRGKITEFLRIHKFSSKDDKHKSVKTIKHKKAKVVFSLPIIKAEAKFLQARASWNGKNIYQILSSGSSRKGENLYQMPALGERYDGELIKLKIVKKPFISKNISNLIPVENRVKRHFPISDSKWYSIDDIPQNLKELGVRELSYREDTVSKRSVKFGIPEIESLKYVERLSKEKYLKTSDLKEFSQDQIDKEYSELQEKKKKESNKNHDYPKTKEKFENEKLEKFIDKFCEKTDDGGFSIQWRVSNNTPNKLLFPVIKKDSPT